MLSIDKRVEVSQVPSDLKGFVVDPSFDPAELPEGYEDNVDDEYFDAHEVEVEEVLGEVFGSNGVVVPVLAEEVDVPTESYEYEADLPSGELPDEIPSELVDLQTDYYGQFEVKAGRSSILDGLVVLEEVGSRYTSSLADQTDFLYGGYPFGAVLMNQSGLNEPL